MNIEKVTLKCRNAVLRNNHGRNHQFVLLPFNYNNNVNACFLLLLPVLAAP